MRCLGLDVGSKTIGIALSDALGVAAHPLEVWRREGREADVEHIRSLVAQHEVETVVVGLPLELSGQVGRRAQRVRVLIDALRAAFGEGGPTVVEWDERFSTAAVERVLIDADMSRGRRKQVVDKQAAAFILQGWLESRRDLAT